MKEGIITNKAVETSFFTHGDVCPTQQNTQLLNLVLNEFLSFNLIGSLQ